MLLQAFIFTLVASIIIIEASPVKDNANESSYFSKPLVIDDHIPAEARSVESTTTDGLVHPPLPIDPLTTVVRPGQNSPLSSTAGFVLSTVLENVEPYFPFSLPTIDFRATTNGLYAQLYNILALRRLRREQLRLYRKTYYLSPTSGEVFVIQSDENDDEDDDDDEEESATDTISQTLGKLMEQLTQLLAERIAAGPGVDAGVGAGVVGAGAAVPPAIG